ncbi:MAG: hypothetical protein ACREER_09150 [Alphaproteobacteria bacterium]
MASFAETWFGPIVDREQAQTALRGAAHGAVVLAVIYALDPVRFLRALGGAVFELDVALVLDAGLLVYLALMALRHRSRAFAALLAAWVALYTVGTVLFRMSHIPFGNNVLLAVAGLYVAFRMVLASQRWHRLAGTRLAGRVAVIKNLAGCAVSALALVVLAVALDRLTGAGGGSRAHGSLTLLVAVVAYSLPFSSWFPWLGRRALTRPGA